MYIPITKTEEKCVGQLSYGFNILDKLEGCTHEKFFPYGDLDFLNFVYKRFRINKRTRLSNFASFHTFFYKGISFRKLTLPHFFEQNRQMQSLRGYGFFESCIQHF